MGTSTSYRSPAKPRWQAFVAALSSGTSIDRIRSEMFNAGDEWEEALAAPAVASFVDSLVTLYGDFPERVAGKERPDDAVMSLISDAKQASHDVGFSAAFAVAERAFARLLLSIIEGVGDSPDIGAIVERWRIHRGADSREIVVSYAGELFAQYARHVVDREAGRLARRDLQVDMSSVIAIALAGRAQEIGRRTAADLFHFEAPLGEVWASLVAEGFSRGRALPRTTR